MRSGHTFDPVDAAALQCRRFWLPRSTAPDLSDNGFLVDPEAGYPIFTSMPAVPLEAFSDLPVLGLLGEPGMGKSTVLNQEASRLNAVGQQNGDRVLQVDLAACGTEVMVCKRIFESYEFRVWRKTKARIHLLLDGFDTSLHYVKTLVALLLEGLNREPCDRLSLRVACRTAEWPVDLEEGLIAMWEEQNVGIYELAPLRQQDVRAVAEAKHVPADAFLLEIARLGAAPFASRPITLKFLLNSFEQGRGLPSTRPELYRQGCLALCDEWREDRRRSRKYSGGLRFAVAGRLAAVNVLSHRTAIWMASRGKAMPDGDVRRDELLGRKERFDREVVVVRESVVREAADTGLFRSIGPHRLGFSHQTYSEYLAAQYLIDHGLAVSEIVGLILHPDGSGKVVPQLRETAAWLAALVPDIRRALLAKDAATLFASDTPPSSEDDRRELVRQILRLYDTGDLLDIRMVSAVGMQQEGARLKYAGIAGDLKPYIADQARSVTARLAAIQIARFTRQAELQEEVLRVALDEEEPHDNRVAAAVALRTIGNATSKEALKPLVTSAALDDPDDQMKGAALAATWPEHLTASELFEALTPPKRANFIGEYRRFLSSGFAQQLRAPDINEALGWARNHTNKSYADSTPLGGAALSVVAVAIDFSREPEVSDHLAEIVVQLAQVGVPALQVMGKLSSNRDARIDIARKAIWVSPGRWGAWCLRRYGVVEEGDVPFLLAELETGPPVEVQEAVGALIADLLHGASIDSELVQQVLPTARDSRILSAALMPVLGFVVLGSEEAQRQKERFDASRPRPDPKPVPESVPNLDDLLNLVEGHETTTFVKICWRLAGYSWNPNNEVLPGWTRMQSSIQAEIIHSAEMFLNGCCITNTSWIEACKVWDLVTCGYWALRLLVQAAPQIFENLTGDLWRAWVPSAFAERNHSEGPDEAEATILKTAYRRAPSQFRDLFGRFIDAQNRCFDDAFVVNASAAVWDREIADLLRTKLVENRLSPRVFRRILAALLTAGDADAIQIASDHVTSASSAPASEIDKAIQAALEFLNHDASAAWKVAWPVVQKNAEFAQRLLTHYAIDPYSSDAARLRDGLQESELAELYIWLSQFAATLGAGEETGRQHLGTEAFELNSSNRGWYWLSVAVMNTLIQRGTSAAVEAIRNIHENAPDERLKHVAEMAKEVVQQNTWTPLSPSELIDLVTGARGASTGDVKPIADASPAVPRPANPKSANGFELPRMPPNVEPSLASRLQEGEKISDLRLRGMYEAVTRYGWYLKELRSLKVASKKYQTPDLLKERFPRFELWKVLESSDVVDIAAGEFRPGHFSWSLVKRLIGLTGNDDRTLKNYRRALRIALISF